MSKRSKIVLIILMVLIFAGLVFAGIYLFTGGTSISLDMFSGGEPNGEKVKIADDMVFGQKEYDACVSVYQRSADEYSQKPGEIQLHFKEEVNAEQANDFLKSIKSKQKVADEKTLAFYIINPFMVPTGQEIEFACKLVSLENSLVKNAIPNRDKIVAGNENVNTDVLNSNTNENENENENTNENTNENDNANENENTNTNSNQNLNLLTNENENENANANSNVNFNVNLNSNKNTNSNLNSNTNKNTNSNSNLNSNTNSNTNQSVYDEEQFNECFFLAATSASCKYKAGVFLVEYDQYNSEDADDDEVADIWEDILGLDPDKADTDGDGFNDGEEILNGYNPFGAGEIQFIYEDTIEWVEENEAKIEMAGVHLQK